MNLNTPSWTRFQSKMPQLAGLIGPMEMRELSRLVNEAAEEAAKYAVNEAMRMARYEAEQAVRRAGR